MSDLATVQNEIKRYGDAAVATKAQVEALAKEMPETKARLADVEQLLAGGIRGGGALTDPSSQGGYRKSLADEVGRSDSFQSFMSGNAPRFKSTLERSMLETKNTVVDSSNNLVAPDRRPGIIEGPQRSLRIRDLFPVLPTSTNLIEATREASFVNNAAPQAGEGGQKAESDLTYELASWKVETIAHFIKASKQSLADQPVLAEVLNNRMTYGVSLAEEAQLLSGDGTGNNLSGILTTGNHVDYNRVTAADTKLDELRRAITQLQLTDYAASGIILNPADWEAVCVEKDGDGNYVYGTPGAMTPPQLWGLPVVPSNSLTAGTFVVADFMNAGAVFDRQQTVVEAFEEDGDNVQRNLVTIRAENRVALAIMRPSAIVVGSFA